MNLLKAIMPAIAWCSVASAATIIIDSHPGLSTSVQGVQTVAITPDSAWEANNPDGLNAVWISYADTGYGGTYFQTSEGTAPVITVFDTFQSGAGVLSLSVWADDTAGVLLDGNLLMAPAFTQDVCSGQPIGCRPQDAGNITAALVAASTL